MIQNYNPLLLIDYYKSTHAEQFPKDTTKVVSYFTPRSSRLNSQHLIFFGLQGFIKDYFIEAFNKNFFSRPKSKILSEYQRIIDYTLGADVVKYEKISALHDLGYLPIEIKALPEGTKVPVGVPMYEISNTIPEFYWLTNTLETMMSATLHHIMISANVGYWFRELTNKYWAISVDDHMPRSRAISDFGMRGGESVEASIYTSAGFLLSYALTATLPSVMWLEDNYNCNIEKEVVGLGGISTEHATVTSNFAVDGDEITMMRRLLTETYATKSFSFVSDSYDYFNLLQNILPELKKEILARENVVFKIRPDSGNTIDICIRTIEILWNIFGGTINSKGYKVLDPHIGAIYGDGITLPLYDEICKRLIEKGFAVSNLTLGVGAFSFQALQEDGVLKPFTRDTYNCCVKATYIEVNGKPIHIFKDPKTDTGNFKKSQRGCCVVYERDGNIFYQDGLNFVDTRDKHNLLKTVFRNGKMEQETSLSEIRKLLNGDKF